jgi:hypothetical protein
VSLTSRLLAPFSFGQRFTGQTTKLLFWSGSIDGGSSMLSIFDCELINQKETSFTEKFTVYFRDETSYWKLVS